MVGMAPSRPAARVAPVVRPPGSPLETAPRGGDYSPDRASAYGAGPRPYPPAWAPRRGVKGEVCAAKAAPACEPNNRSDRTLRDRPERADAGQVEDLRVADGGYAAFDIGGGPPALVERSVGWSVRLAAEKERNVFFTPPMLDFRIILEAHNPARRCSRHYRVEAGIELFGS